VRQRIVDLSHCNRLASAVVVNSALDQVVCLPDTNEADNLTASVGVRPLALCGRVADAQLRPLQSHGNGCRYMGPRAPTPQLNLSDGCTKAEASNPPEQD